MNDAVMMAEDVKHRRNRQRGLFVVFRGGEDRSFEPAERHDMTMPMLRAFGKSGRASREEHHRMVFALGQRLGQASAALFDPLIYRVSRFTDDNHMRNSQACPN